MSTQPPLANPALEAWNKQLAEAIAELTTDNFFPELLKQLAQSVAIDYPQVWLYRRDLTPKALYFQINEKERRAQIDNYIDGSYQLDPFYLAAVNNQQPEGLYRMTELSVRGFQQSDYYRSYYAQCDTADEIAFMIDLDEGTSLQISLMRNQGSPRFSEQELDFFRAIEPTIRELALQHAKLTNLAERAVDESYVAPGFEKNINQAFDLFGRSLLTGREKDVLGLTLQGCSTDVAAEKLNISIETLRRHRKHIYKKLDVNSQAELFSLFFNSLSCFESAPTQDPLAIYMGTDDKNS
ncbi:LuxR C-terminal-related transcriptional regulator [Dasania sp. GY-MA-18]|uniref:LuxR C-terminal-related transcriptional regulator n=1 Tax=Dasania phycosphaerae TaxID=2950436 RepID=A0A9J6RNM6_9GAMM|nr:MULTISPECIES: LuxR C-terminal-related transcriptional regulator [Dasania]MCR8923512.1 LuxR C-terminal-related transcriptional regulator [Dasania sp. GY-MA-18]MCZ0865946.1 LuxR C-terminal-related transcriptional regulator [Dasania phycosphaerae]MCZ0869670.1 LuxR C-terminal-related transcriptional regulator [Dasania phycosphaerae]